MKKVMIFGGLIAAFATVAITMTACSSENNPTQSTTNPPVTSKTRLELAYDAVSAEYPSATSCYEIGSDGSYIEVDTNPYNIDDYYNPTYQEVLQAFNSELEVPDYVYQLMISTTAMQGRQTETVSGLIISWTYHPDNGLEVLYRLQS